jgi:imidazolonepropionase-like amidohydrolase
MQKQARTFLPLLLAVAVLVTGAAAQEPPLVIRHVSVIDATGAPPQPEMTVVIEGRRITRIGKSARVRVPKNARVIEARGKFLIPGLWDMHVHEIFGDWIPAEEHVTPLLFVANGVTGVRDMGGDLAPLQLWRLRIAAGQMIGPRIILAGPMLDGPVPQFPSSAPVRDAAEARRIVRELKSQGVDFIKIQSLISREGYFAAAAEAKARKIPFAGHVPDKVRAAEASAAGQKSIEHLTGVFEGASTAEDELMSQPRGPGRRRYLDTFSEERAQSLLALFAKNRTWQTPTLFWERGEWLIEQTNSGPDPLAKYAPAAWRERTWPLFTREISAGWSTDPLADRQAFVQAELKMVAAMHRAGVPLLAGTDTAAGVRVYPGFSLHDELGMLVQAGLTPLEALQAATRNAGEFLQLADSGTIEAGKRADLVLLDANPLEEIGNTRKIRGVVLAGRYFSRADLDGLLREAEEAAARSK